MVVKVEFLRGVCELIVDCPHFTPEWTSSGFLVIRNQNIKDGVLDLSNPSFTNKRDFDRRIKRAKPKAGDIIFTREAPMGEVCLLPDGLECCVGQRQVLIRPGKAIDGRFLFYALRSPFVRQQIFWNEGTGSTVSNVRIPVLEAFKIPRLGVEEKLIGDLLGSLDDKIELNRRMNETLEAMAQAIFRDWFVDFGPTRRKTEGATDPVVVMGGLVTDAERAQRLADLFPDSLEDDGLPVGWKPRVASAVVEFNPKEPLRKGTLAFYSDMSSLPTSGSIAELPVEREFGSGMRFRNGDALLARITPCLENGKAAYVDFLPDESAVGWGSTEFYVLRSRKGVPAELAYLLARHPEFRAVAIASMTGTSGRQRAQVDRLEEFPFVETTQDVMAEFGKFTKPMFDKISANGRENRTLAATRNLLLPKLMSGEIRLGEAEEMTEAAQ